MARWFIPFFAALLFGCNAPPPAGADRAARESLSNTDADAPTVNNSPPDNVNERIAVLERLGFTRDHTGDGYVQYVRETITVDLDLDDDGIHVTPIDKSATKMTDEMIESAIEIYESLGVPIRDLAYRVTPTNGGGPEIHRSEIRDWNMTMRHWPEGVAGMFVAFSVEKR